MEAGISSALMNDNIECFTRLDEAISLLPSDPEINLLSLQLQNRYRQATLKEHGRLIGW